MTEKARKKAERRWIEKFRPDNEKEFLDFLSALSCRALLKPVVREDLLRGVSPTLLAERYDLSINQVWRIGVAVGVYPKYKTGN